MATLTIRSLSEELVERLKLAAARSGRSMEQEVRQLLEQRYASRGEVLQRIEERWQRLPKATAAEIAAWIAEGRE
jgi:plasmid stability protein